MSLLSLLLSWIVLSSSRSPAAAASPRRTARRSPWSVHVHYHAVAAEPHAGPVLARTAAGLDLVGLHRRYGAVRALDGLDLPSRPGELVALLGPSGCGKTTALRIVAGFEHPDAGHRRGQRAPTSTAVPPAKRDMGMVFQSYSLFPHLTAADNVGVRAAGARRGRGGPAGAAAAELLDLVGMAEHRPAGTRTSSPAASSSGSRWPGRWPSQPTVLLLDEPLSALDAKVRLQLRDEIRRHPDLASASPPLLVTHDQEEALSIADRVAVMRAGRLEQCAAAGRAVRAAGHRVRRRVRRHHEPAARR